MIDTISYMDPAFWVGVLIVLVPFGIYWFFTSLRPVAIRVALIVVFVVGFVYFWPFMLLAVIYISLTKRVYYPINSGRF